MIINKNIFNNSKILVVGDLILDEYWFGSSERLSPEAPVPVVTVNEFQYRLGAAGNVANNIQTLGGKSKIISTIGKNKKSLVLKSLLKKNRINFKLIDNKKNNTISKVRILANNAQIVRADIESNYEIKNHKKFLSEYKKNLKDVNVVVFSDYGKGTLEKINDLISIAKKKMKIIIVDPKGDDFGKYRGVNFLTPNLKEFTSIVGHCTDQKNLEFKARKLIKNLKLEALLVTQGKNGMTLIHKNGSANHIKSLVEEVYDVSGAGDTVVSVLSLCISSGISLLDSVKIANIAAGIIVKKIGTSTLNISELLESLSNTSNHQYKINSDIKFISSIVKNLKKNNKKIVMTNGCFDILHPGHIDFLMKSKQLGDILIVAINSDNSVRKLKGKQRPINNLQERIKVLSSIKYIDHIISFEEQTPLKLYSKILPDVITKGGDYKESDVVGGKEIKKSGGEVKIIKLYHNYSTSSLINKRR